MSAPPSPPNGIVSANIKLFNNKVPHDSFDSPSNTRPAPPLSPQVASSPRLPPRPDVTTLAAARQHLYTSPHSVKNIRRHATGDDSKDQYLHQIQHQKVFPHATGNGQLQSSHSSSNESFFRSFKYQQEQPQRTLLAPPPPPRPSGATLAAFNINNDTNNNNKNSSNVTLTALAKKQDDATKPNNSSSHVNTKVFKGVLGKMVGSVSGKLIWHGLEGFLP